MSEVREKDSPTCAMAEFAGSNRALILAALLSLAGAGWYATKNLPDETCEKEVLIKV